MAETYDKTTLDGFQSIDSVVSNGENKKLTNSMSRQKSIRGVGNIFV